MRLNSGFGTTKMTCASYKNLVISRLLTFVNTLMEIMAVQKINFHQKITKMVLFIKDTIFKLVYLSQLQNQNMSETIF